MSMSHLQTSPAARWPWLAAAIAVVAVIATITVVHFNQRPATPSTQPSGPTLQSPREPSLSLDTLRHVIVTGGCRLTREAAIAWLDQHARQRNRLDNESEKTLLDLLADGHGHSDWSSGYRQHLFNSACNALRVRPSETTVDALARTLHAHATGHPDRILRLYALQHIDSLRKAGHLDGPLAGEIHASLQHIAASPENDVAGTAIHLLAEWDGSATSTPPAILELAAVTAADRSRPVDIRVSAIHTAGPAALETARAIASDPAEPVILRKAAIARIGRHGTGDDVASLTTLNAESARLAQAAGPALSAIRTRAQNPATPQPVPYQ